MYLKRACLPSYQTLRSFLESDYLFCDFKQIAVLLALSKVLRSVLESGPEANQKLVYMV